MSMVQKLTNVIFRVDKDGNKMAPKKERKNYLILAMYNETEGDKPERVWEWIDGRAETVDYLLEQLETFDIFQSQIMSETQAPDSAVNIYAFLRYCVDECDDQKTKEVFENHEYDLDLLNEFAQNYYDKDEKQLNEIYEEEMNQ